jgi:hypothetical protein
MSECFSFAVDLYKVHVCRLRFSVFIWFTRPVWNSKMDRKQFDADLSQKLKEYEEDACPFWVKGPGEKAHPFDAVIIFIGINPSSGGNWRASWDADAGFDLNAYSSGREPSETRKRIIAKAGSGTVCMNTNVFWQVSKRFNKLRKKRGDLPWLFERLPHTPVVVVHGLTAEREYKRLRGKHSQMPKEEEVIFCRVHLSGMGATSGTVVAEQFDNLQRRINEALAVKRF